MKIHIPRLPKHARFMMQAHLVATQNTCDRGPELLLDAGRHGVGAVIVQQDRIIAGGYNGSAPGQPHCNEDGHLLVDGHCVRTIHSEMNAIIQCALDGTSPQGGTIYTTASPCFDCAKAIVRAGIRMVYFGQGYESRYGLSSTVKEFLSTSGVEMAPLILDFDDSGTLVWKDT